MYTVIMSDEGGYHSLVQELREDVSRLQAELEQTTQERVQAAECGLAVLEEKQQLESQYEELDRLYETTKHELECAKEVRMFNPCFWYEIFDYVFVIQQ